MWNYFRQNTNNGDNDDDSSLNGGQYYVNSNIDTDYDGYQQAWRILGVYVDCSNYINSASVSSNNNNNNNHGCQRYLVWASYIDLQYQGGSIGEYQYYNTSKQMYDDAACIATNNERCAPMDCHEATSTTWSLMGIYKEPYYASEFFEQLFKHLGYCTWDSNTYSFMQNRYASWPDNNGCVASATTNPHTNQPYYIDLKPGPNLTLTLYNDPICYSEHVVSDSDDNDVLNVDAILQKAGYLSSEQIRQFNDAMMPFHNCQPCRAYNLDNTDGSLYGNNNNDNNNNDPNYPKYSCSDAAGYTNVNQCMKFRTHTQMMPMTRTDIHIAILQGAVTHIQFWDESHRNDTATAKTTQQQQQLHTLSSSYQSIYFQPSLNEDSNALRISNAGAYVVLSVAILFTFSTIYYCCSVYMWVRRKNAKQILV